MKQAVQRHWKEAATTTKTTIEGSRVPSGKILEVKSFAGHHDNQATTESTTFYADKDGEVVRFGTVLAPDVDYEATLPGSFLIHEGQRPAALFSDAANTEVMNLHISGILWDLETWRNQEA